MRKQPLDKSTFVAIDLTILPPGSLSPLGGDKHMGWCPMCGRVGEITPGEPFTGRNQQEYHPATAIHAGTERPMLGRTAFSVTDYCVIPREREQEISYEPRESKPMGRPRIYREPRQRLTVELPQEIVAAIDAGLNRATKQTRTAWIETAIREKLERDEATAW